MVSAVESRKGHRQERPRPTGVRSPTSRGSEWKDTTAVLLSEGDEAKREGAWGVGVPRKYR
jgi:hypothetical protein